MFDYEKLIIPNTKPVSYFALCQKNHEQTLQIQANSFFKVLHIVPGRDAAHGSPKGIPHSLFSNKLVDPWNLEAPFRWEQMCFQYSWLGKHWCLWTGKVWEQEGFSQHSHCRPWALKPCAFHHLLSCCPRNMQGRLSCYMAGTTTTSRQGKLKLTALKERRLPEQKQEMPTAVEPVLMKQVEFNEK